MIYYEYAVMELENQVVRRPEKLTVLLVRVASGVDGHTS
jgi:hypothetical protein